MITLFKKTWHSHVLPLYYRRTGVQHIKLFVILLIIIDFTMKISKRYRSAKKFK